VSDSSEEDPVKPSAGRSRGRGLGEGNQKLQDKEADRQ